MRDGIWYYLPLSAFPSLCLCFSLIYFAEPASWKAGWPNAGPQALGQSPVFTCSLDPELREGPRWQNSIKVFFWFFFFCVNWSKASGLAQLPIWNSCYRTTLSSCWSISKSEKFQIICNTFLTFTLLIPFNPFSLPLLNGFLSSFTLWGTLQSSPIWEKPCKLYILLSLQIWPEKCACEEKEEDGSPRDHLWRRPSTKIKCVALAISYQKVWTRKMSSQDFPEKGILFLFGFWEIISVTSHSQRLNSWMTLAV